MAPARHPSAFRPPPAKSLPICGELPKFAGQIVTLEPPAANKQASERAGGRAGEPLGELAGWWQWAAVIVRRPHQAGARPVARGAKLATLRKWPLAEVRIWLAGRDRESRGGSGRRGAKCAAFSPLGHLFCPLSLSLSLLTKLANSSLSPNSHSQSPTSTPDASFEMKLEAQIQLASRFPFICLLFVLANLALAQKSAASIGSCEASERAHQVALAASESDAQVNCSSGLAGARHAE